MRGEFASTLATGVLCLVVAVPGCVSLRTDLESREEEYYRELQECRTDLASIERAQEDLEEELRGHRDREHARFVAAYAAMHRERWDEALSLWEGFVADFPESTNLAMARDLRDGVRMRKVQEIVEREETCRSAYESLSCERCEKLRGIQKKCGDEVWSRKLAIRCDTLVRTCRLLEAHGLEVDEVDGDTVDGDEVEGDALEGGDPDGEPAVEGDGDGSASAPVAP